MGRYEKNCLSSFPVCSFKVPQHEPGCMAMDVLKLELFCEFCDLFIVTVNNVSVMSGQGDHKTSTI